MADIGDNPDKEIIVEPAIEPGLPLPQPVPVKV